MTAAPTPSAEELEAMYQSLVESLTTREHHMVAAIKALRQQVAELNQMPTMLMQQSTQRLAAIQRLESELTAAQSRIERLELGLVNVRAELRGAGPSCTREFAEMAMQSAWKIAGEALAPASDKEPK